MRGIDVLTVEDAGAGALATPILRPKTFDFY